MTHARFTSLAAATAAALIFTLAGAAQAAAQGPAGAAPPRQTIAFVGVNVVPMDRDGVLAEQTVVVQDGRIAAMGPSGTIQPPEDALRIDARGKYLMPGLAEMHGHLPGENVPREVVENTLFLYVANGVTLVRGMQGHPAQLETRAAIEAGELLGPRLVLAGPGFGGAALDTETAVQRVREQHEAGYDLLKIGENLRPEVYEAIASTAHEAGIPFAGHVPDAVGLHGAFAAGQASVDHLDNYVEALIPADALEGAPPLFGIGRLADRADEGRIREVAAATRDAGVAVVPTMVLWEHFFGGRPGEEVRDEIPELRYVPTQIVEAWTRSLNDLTRNIGDVDGGRRVIELRRRILRALHEAGATILLGTDSPQIFSVPGFSTHRELRLMVEVGMTPYEVLRSGTWTIADHLGELDSAGTVAPGRRADLILLEANPLDDVANVARRTGVVADGRWLPEDEIRRRLDAIAASYSAQ